MTLLWPYALIALPFTLIGLVVLFVRSGRARERKLTQFASARLLPMLLTSHSPALRRFKQGLVALGVLLTVFAFSRPQWGYDWEEQRAHGVDVVFVIDTSRSMLSEDVRPNRLERAKLAIFDCLEKMGSNRVGLVAFAGDAFLQCPLTLDYDAFRQALQAVDTNTIADGGTDISVGLDVAAKALEESGNHKIIVLLTDGEDLEGEGIGEAKALADKGVTVYTVGVGTPEGEIIPIRDANGHTDFVRDQRGEIVKSHLDSSTLTQIATATKGFYEPLGATGEGLMKVYEDGIKKIPEQNLKSQMRRQAIERFQWPLAAGFVLLTLEMLIGTRRPAWRRNAVATVNLAEPIPVSAATTKPSKPNSVAKTPPAPGVLAGILFLAAGTVFLPSARGATGGADTPATTDNPPSAGPVTSSATVKNAPQENYTARDAERLFQKGDFGAAADAYEQAAKTAPLDGRFRYNEGESRYRSGDYEGAAQAYTKALSSNDLSLQQRSYYNLGNAHYRLGQSQLKDDPHKTVTTWESALKDYQNALDLNSTDADARYNLDLAKQQLEALKKQLEQKDRQQQQQQKQSDQNNPPDQKDQPNNQNPNNQDKQNQNQPNQNPPNQPDQNNPQNQPDQKNPQNNPGKSSNQNQNSQNSPDSQNQSQKDQSNPSNQPGAKNPSDTSPQNSANGGQQPKPQNGTGDKSQNSPSPQPAGQQKPQGSGQGKPPQGSGARGAQPQAAQSSGPKSTDQKSTADQPQPRPGANTGKEPNAQAQGQTKPPTNTGGASTAASGSGNPAGTATVNGTMVGVMTREEARQLLDALKTYERKLPADPVQVTAQKPASSDPSHKDW